MQTCTEERYDSGVVPHIIQALAVVRSERLGNGDYRIWGWPRACSAKATEIALTLFVEIGENSKKSNCLVL